MRPVLSIELLKSFTNAELDRFENFINHSYFNKNKRLCLLLKKLRQYVLDDEAFSEEIRLRIYEIVFKETLDQNTLCKKKEKRLNELLNKLLALVEQFLKVEKVKDTDEYDAALLYPELINRQQLLLYSRRIKLTERKLNKVEKRGIQYHKQYYKIQSEKARLLFINNALAKEDNYDLLQYHTDIKYLLVKLEQQLVKITLEHRFAHKTFNHKPFNKLLPLLNLPEYRSNPLIQLYMLNIELAEKEEDTTFFALLKLLKEKQRFIPDNSVLPFYVNLTNYCISQIAKGDLNYFKNLFEIYNEMHEAKLLVKNNTIELALLKNIITNACRIKAFDWAIDKLAYYINYVPATIRNSVYEFNSGIIAFNQQKHETALSHFKEVKKIDDTHELSLRITQLQCFYEIDADYETHTQQIVDSLRAYIRQNKKLTMRKKKGYTNFINIFNKLYKLNKISDKRSQQVAIKKQLSKIKIQLKQFDFILAKQWLLNKIVALEKI